MSIYNQHKPGGTDDLYLKLKDSDKVKMRIASEPAISTYDGVKLRYAWIVWNRDKDKPQIFSFGISIYSQVADLVEEWGEPTDFDITIKRTGSGMNDTEYSVVPVKTSTALTKEQLAEVEKIDLPQAIKGRWLADFIKDKVMPEPVKPLETQKAPEFNESDVPPEELPDGF